MSYEPDYKYLPPFGKHFLTPFFDFFCAVAGIGKGFRRKVLRACLPKDGDTVIDVGCGTGVFLETALGKCPNLRVQGFDPDARALAIAGERLAKFGGRAVLTKAFAETLPVAEASVDICFSSLAFHHMPDSIKKQAIQEMYRVLKPDGRLVIADFGPTKSVFVRKILFFERMEYIEGNFRGLINRYLAEAGFEDIKVVGKRFPAIQIVVGSK